MESLRLAQRRVVQKLFQEFVPASARQSVRRQGRSLHIDSKPLRSNTRVSSSKSSPRSFILPQAPFSKRQPLRKPLNFFSHRTIRHSSSSATATAPSNGNQSLSQRLKTLTREYGWAAVGVYLTLSALDFPFCLLAVRLMGAERVGHFEHQVLHYLKEKTKWPMEKLGWEWGKDQLEEHSKEVKREAQALEIPIEPNGQQERRLLDDQDVIIATNKSEEEFASIWTQLALAYAIHKSLLIFVRVPLAVAVTPKVVKTLRGWGWNIGKKQSKSTGVAAQKSTGVNTKASRTDKS